MLRGIGLGPDLAERVWQAALVTSAGTGAAAVLRLFRPRIGPEHWLVAFLYGFGPFAAVYLVPTNLFVGHAFAPWFLYAFVRGVTGARPWRWAALFASARVRPGEHELPGAHLRRAADRACRRVPRVRGARTVTWGRIGSWVLRGASSRWRCPRRAGDRARQQRDQRGEPAAHRDRARDQPHVVLVGVVARARVLGAYWGIRAAAIVPQFAVFFWWPVCPPRSSSPSRPPRPCGARGGVRRLLYAAVLALGLVVMVGAFPLDAPTPYGRALLWAFDHFPGILAVRSGHKAGVLVALGAATLGAVAFAGAIRAACGAGTWRHPLPIVAVAAAVGVVVVGAFPFWTGRLFFPTTAPGRSPATGTRPSTTSTPARARDASSSCRRPRSAPTRGAAPATTSSTGSSTVPRSRGLLSTWSGTAETANVVAASMIRQLGHVLEPGVIGPVARRLAISTRCCATTSTGPPRNDPGRATSTPARQPRPRACARTFGAPGQNVARPMWAAPTSDPASDSSSIVGSRTTASRAPATAARRCGRRAVWPGLAADGALRRGGHPAVHGRRLDAPVGRCSARDPRS